MDYREITVFTTTAASELVADILSDLGSEGVGIYDKNDFLQLCKSDVVWDYVDESVLAASEVVRVLGYFPEESADEVERELGERLDDLKRDCAFETGSLETSRRVVGDEDWNVVWRKFYSPIECGGVAVVPGWIDYTPKEGVKVVKMDPGMAFGTGEHETTRLCLKLMQDGPIVGARTADLGTGSGILRHKGMRRKIPFKGSLCHLYIKRNFQIRSIRLLREGADQRDAVVGAVHKEDGVLFLFQGGPGPALRRGVVPEEAEVPADDEGILPAQPLERPVLEPLQVSVCIAGEIDHSAASR